MRLRSVSTHEDGQLGRAAADAGASPRYKPKTRSQFLILYTNIYFTPVQIYLYYVFNLYFIPL